jgi:protein-S-isoprenylcysteine O-methyltransferase Ste14
MLGLSKANTAIDVRDTTTTIVSKGIYAFSRNPIYLSMTILYIGVSFLFNSLSVLLMLIPILIVMHFGVILREEKYLENKFGDDYLSYKKRVRRWI